MVQNASILMQYLKPSRSNLSDQKFDEKIERDLYILT